MSQSARQIAVALLARRDHSRQELQIKLRQKAFESLEIEQALDYCESNQYLCDERYAQLLIKSHISKGYGPAKIKQSLYQKGVSKSIVSEVLLQTDCDWFLLAKSRALKKFAGKPIADAKDKAKRIRFLMGQGFSYDQVAFALEYDPYET